MSVSDTTPFDRITVDDETPGLAALAERRLRACDEIETELAAGGFWTDEPALALRWYGSGCVAVGIAGSVDRAMAHRVGALLHELRSRSSRELVLDLARLARWDAQLARVIGQARIHRLIDGGRLELRGAPPELTTALGSPGDAGIVDAAGREPAVERGSR